MKKEEVGTEDQDKTEKAEEMTEEMTEETTEEEKEYVVEEEDDLL